MDGRVGRPQNGQSGENRGIQIVSPAFLGLTYTLVFRIYPQSEFFSIGCLLVFVIMSVAAILTTANVLLVLNQLGVTSKLSHRLRSKLALADYAGIF